MINNSAFLFYSTQNKKLAPMFFAFFVLAHVFFVVKIKSSMVEFTLNIQEPLCNLILFWPPAGTALHLI